MSWSDGRIFGADGTVRSFSGGVHECTIVSMGTFMNDGPWGTRWASSPGPHQLLVHGVRAGGLSAPLGKGVGEPVRPTHHAEVAVPLPLGVDLRVLAVAGRLARAHQHGHLADHGAVHAHAALQQADAGVQQDRLHAARHPGVPAGHVHRQGLVPAVDVLRPRRLVDLLAGQGLPHRRPFRTGGRDYVINAKIAECFENTFAAVLRGGRGHISVLLCLTRSRAEHGLGLGPGRNGLAFPVSGQR